MKIRFNCPHCGQKISTAEDQRGLGGICPKCNEHLVVPAVTPPPLPTDASSALPQTAAVANGPSGSTSPGWLRGYVVASSLLVLVLLGILLLRPSAAPPAPQGHTGHEEPAQAAAQALKIREAQASALAEQNRALEQQAARLREQERVAEELRKNQAAEQERLRLAEEAREKEEEDAALVRRAKVKIDAIDDRITSLQESLSDRQATSRELETSVENYVMSHKMATAALALGLGGTSVALDSTNNFSDEAKAAGAVGAIAVGIWLASDEENLTEVVQVGSELAKASNTQDQYKRDITELNRQITAKQSEKASLAISVNCSSCNKSFLLIREHWNTGFNCPHCKTSLKLTNPPS